MKKIVVSSYDDLHNTFYGGGGAMAVQEIFQRLANEYSITVITGKYPGCKSAESVNGVDYVRVGSRINSPKLSQIIFQIMLPYYAVKMKYDLWIESFTPPFSVSLLPFFVNKPLIGLVHMLSGEDMQRKYKLPFPLIEKAGIHFYHNIISPSDINTQSIKKIIPKANIITIPNGSESPIISDQKRLVKKYISFIGRIEINQKGLDLLLRAYKKIAGQVPFKLQIAGSGDPKEITNLHKLIRQLGLESQVILKGKVFNQGRSDFFKETLILVIPSRFETFSLVAQEALAAGTPIVSFDINGLGWLPRNCAYKIQKFDVKKLSEAILELVNNQRLRRQLSTAAVEESQKYSWDKSVEKYRLFIRQTLSH